MAQAQQSQAVDLFGNPNLTPRQLMQQQLARIMQSTAQETAGADPRTRGVSKMGAAAGGLLGNVLINAGVLPKPPEMVRAEKLAAARDAIQKDAAEKGLSPEANPTEFANMAVSHFLRAGDEKAAMMAIDWRNLQEANARAAELERATIENVKADTAKKGREPTEGGGRPFWTYHDTPEGLVAADARAPRIVDPATRQEIRRPVVKSVSDPKLQGDLALAKEAGKKGAENIFAQRQLAMDATNNLLGIGEARKLLDEGMKTGKFANFETGLGATLHELGISFAEGEVENAQAFVASQSKQVAAIIKSFGAGTGLSDADREFAIKAAGGDITMNEKSIRKILDINERAALNVIKNYKDLYGRVKKEYLPFSMELPEVPKAPKSGKSAAPELPAGWKVKTK